MQLNEIAKVAPELTETIFAIGKENWYLSPECKARLYEVLKENVLSQIREVYPLTPESAEVIFRDFNRVNSEFQSQLQIVLLTLPLSTKLGQAFNGWELALGCISGIISSGPYAGRISFKAWSSANKCMTAYPVEKARFLGPVLKGF